MTLDAVYKEQYVKMNHFLQAKTTYLILLQVSFFRLITKYL